MLEQASSLRGPAPCGISGRSGPAGRRTAAAAALGRMVRGDAISSSSAFVKRKMHTAFYMLYDDCMIKPPPSACRADSVGEQRRGAGEAVTLGLR